MKKSVFVIVGPTATGKSALAVEIATYLGTEIISADSQLIYRELNIGTAKPSLAEQGGIKHYMIDCAAPDEIFSAAQYEQEANVHLTRLWKEGKTPVIVGGTGFYIDALLALRQLPEVPPNPEFRQKLLDMAEPIRMENPLFLHRLLQEKDPQRAAQLHPNDWIRLLRALEIIESTGQPVPQPHESSGSQALQIRWIGLTYENRDLLRQRIDERIECMIQAGWEDEVEDLLKCYGPQAHALQVALGYPQLVKLISGQCTREEALQDIRIRSHQYARRQMTWFKRNPSIEWIFRDQTSDISVESLLKNIGHHPG